MGVEFAVFCVCLHLGGNDAEPSSFGVGKLTLLVRLCRGEVLVFSHFSA